MRNCGNRMKLSNSSRVVTWTRDERGALTPEGKKAFAELQGKGVKQVRSYGDMIFYECPETALTIDTKDMMSAIFLTNGSGHLLHDGGWGSQPVWFVMANQIYKEEEARRKGNK